MESRRRSWPAFPGERSRMGVCHQTARGQIEPMGRWEGVDPRCQRTASGRHGKEGDSRATRAIPLSLSTSPVRLCRWSRSHGRSVAWWGERRRGRRGRQRVVGSRGSAHWADGGGSARLLVVHGACGSRPLLYGTRATRNRSELPDRNDSPWPLAIFDAESGTELGAK